MIICGRRIDKLQEAKEKMPELYTMVCDVANEADRKRLFDTIVNEFPELDVLVNNAGIQQRNNLQDLNAGRLSLRQMNFRSTLCDYGQYSLQHSMSY